jgi:hypothetical protein
MTMPNTTTLLTTRRAKSEVVLGELGRSIEDWLDQRDRKDTRRQHATQLAAIGAVLRRGLARLENDFDAIPANGDAGAFFAATRALDARMIWFDRLWRYFDVKFAQRGDHSAFKNVLLLADEMVWSCYSQVFDRARALALPISEHMSAPLAFVDPQYSPAAFPSKLVPDDLQGRDAPEWLGDVLNRMPVSVVRIPPSAAAAPWSLALLAHEVGHHIQFDLLPDKRLVTAFRTAIEEAVAQTDSFSEAKTWGRWSVEVFADIFSAVCIGPWAVRAMFELEFSKPEAIAAPREFYPPGATRLALLAAAVDRVTASTRGARELRGLVAVDANDAVLKAVLDVALGPLPEVGATLSQLCDTGVDGFATDIASWAESLARGENREPDKSTRSARILVSAACDAWDTIAAASEGKALETAHHEFCRRVEKAILLGAPDGERGAEDLVVATEPADDVINAIWKETA